MLPSSSHHARILVHWWRELTSEVAKLGGNHSNLTVRLPLSMMAWTGLGCVETARFNVTQRSTIDHTVENASVHSWSASTFNRNQFHDNFHIHTLTH